MNRRGEQKNKKNPPPWEIRISAEALAWNLRLDAMLNARKTGAIREKLVRLYRFAVKIGFLSSYQIDQPGTKGRIVDVLKLNPDAFRHLVPNGANSGTK